MYVDTPICKSSKTSVSFLHHSNLPKSGTVVTGDLSLKVPGCLMVYVSTKDIDDSVLIPVPATSFYVSV